MWKPVLFLWCALAAQALPQSQLQTIHLPKPWAAGHGKSLARLAPSNHLDLVLGLPLRNQAALAGLLHDLYDPASPSYHKYLTPAQFAERFAPSEQDYQQVARFAVSRGLAITGSHANRTLLDVNGTVPDIEKAFHVRMGTYPHPTEARVFYAPDTDPSVDLATPIAAVVGLDNFFLPRPMNPRLAFDGTNAAAYPSGSGPVGYFLGTDFRAAYAPGVIRNGTGQSVGLFELDGYYPGDVAEYESLAKLPSVPLTNILLDNFSGTPGQNDLEVTLDIDMAISMAPGLSEVVVYEGLAPDDVLNSMATDNRASQLSCSWGFGPQTDMAREQIYEQFAAQGQTMFQAAGDSGAYASAVYPPSDDPNLTVVGGTLVATEGPGGPWFGETTWSGSGGGISTVFPLPVWQEGLGTPSNQASANFRNIPDVAAQGETGSIWMIAYGGEQGLTGGTSAATPLWAAFAALANEEAAARGQPPIGFINPTLYAIGRSASYAAAFHDITTGNNTNASSPTNFFAGPGYDLCTGWGSPAGSNLIDALVSPPDALQVFPPGGLAASGPAGGPFSPVSQNFTLTNIGGVSINWQAAGTAPWLNVSPAGGTAISNGPAAPVTLSVNSAASNLPPGTYTATVWFTNLNDGFAQSRSFTLNAITNSALPVILSQPASQTALPGAPVVFTVGAVGAPPLSYQWQQGSSNLSDGGNISGSTTATLTVNNVSAAAAGTYAVTVSNALGSVASAGAALTVAPVTAAGVTFSDLYSFTGAADGALPNGLMQETNGNFYGTTALGGSNDVGTVFQITPAGVETTLFSFNNAGGGENPGAALTQGANGNLYGTTEGGGANGWGTIFQVTTNGGFSNVYTFDGGDGGNPTATMILAADGNFYGTTSSGGMHQSGEVFRLQPDGALSQLVSFDYVNGFNPNKLLQGADGGFYGTTFDGGTNGNGTIFDMNTNGVLNTVFTFSYLSGGYLPVAGLAQDAGGALYGTTYEGGTSGYGTIFAILPAPSFALRTFYSFTGQSDGGHPAADLIQGSDGNFYGTTANGGLYGEGTVFRVPPGGAPVTLVSFDGYNGAYPAAPLVQGTDGNLYGATQSGGAGGHGVVFRVNINSPSVQITGQPSIQRVFLGATAVFDVAVTGNPPLFYQWRADKTNLVDGGNISGSTTRVLTVSDVGASNEATYSVTVSNAAGSTAASDGAILQLIQSPPQILTPPASQTASVGGTVIFQVFADGDVPLTYQWQSNQINFTNGAGVSGATTSLLTLSGLKQTSNATISVIVSNALGAVTASATLAAYPLSAPGTRVSSLYSFTGRADGGTPNGLALGANGVLYGTTQTGGANNDGVVFSVATNGVFQTLVTFNLTNGSNPQAALALGADGHFYGTTENGGLNNGGTVFELSAGGVLSTLAFFTNQNNLNPYTALTQGPAGHFYGASKNASSSGLGSIYEVATNGALNVVYSFTGGPDGNEPVGALALGGDGNFYGLTTAEAAHGYGGVFKMTPGGALTNIYSFTGGADGYNPDGALAQGSDGYFYGVTRRNVEDNVTLYGTIFKVSTSGALTTLYALDPNVFGDGAYPFAGLIQGADGQFYGDTYLGGGANNDGVVFSITSAGSYSNLVAFDGADDGANPESALVQDAAGNFYGTTTAGGPFGKGSIFRLTITSAPSVTVPPSNQFAVPGASAQFDVSVFGASPLGYQWLKNGVALPENSHFAGSASRVLTVNNITANDAGTYSVIVSNALGAAASAGATLTVGEPPAFQSVAQAAGSLVLTWSATAGQTYQMQTSTNLAAGDWTNVGGVLTATNGNLSASFNIDSISQQFYRVVLLP